MKTLTRLFTAAVTLAVGGIIPQLHATDLFVSGSIGTCQPVANNKGCGVSFQLYPNPPQSKPADWVLNSITITFDVVNDSSTTPVEFALGIDEDDSKPLYYPILGTLNPSQDLSSSAGPFTQGDPGTMPPGFGTPSSLDFTFTNWNDPTSNGVLPAVIFNVSSSGGANLTLNSITLDVNFTQVPEPRLITLTGLGFLLCFCLSRRLFNAGVLSGTQKR